jgi:hypothetical protein
MTYFSPLTTIFVFIMCLLSHALLSCLASLPSALATRGDSVHFLTFAMARVKSTAHFVGAATRSGNEGHESEGSTERTESAQLSDVGSHSGAIGDTELFVRSFDREGRPHSRDD